jgi:uncharacterized membrane protein YqiK
MTEEIIHAVDINCETGEETYRPLTTEELAAREEARIAWEAQKAEQEAVALAAAEAKASAQAKLAALGLTPEEIAAL